MALFGCFGVVCKMSNVNFDLKVKRLAFKFCKGVCLGFNLEPIFLCVGNSNLVADLFGPMCGEMLKNSNKTLKVFGTLNSNVTSNNVNQVYKLIKQKYPLNPVVIIDSAVGEVEELGRVKFCFGGCFPAHKTNTTIMGDFSFLGVVNTIGINDFMLLKSVKFNSVCNQANVCVSAVLEGIKLIEVYKNYSNNFGA